MAAPTEDGAASAQVGCSLKTPRPTRSARSLAVRCENAPAHNILAAIVAPALAQLGVPQLATHFFVFYFGVLADVTPPVALAAFAAAGIARSEPMRTGLTAFRLSMGKALVPFAFVYTPALLLIDFTWPAFLIATVSAIVAVMGLGAAYTGHFGHRIGRPAFLALMSFRCR